LGQVMGAAGRRQAGISRTPRGFTLQSRQTAEAAMDLIFYTNPMSRGRIARWILEEVGQPYRPAIMHAQD